MKLFETAHVGVYILRVTNKLLESILILQLYLLSVCKIQYSHSFIFQDQTQIMHLNIVPLKLFQTTHHQSFISHLLWPCQVFISLLSNSQGLLTRNLNVFLIQAIKKSCLSCCVVHMFATPQQVVGNLAAVVIYRGHMSVLRC